MSRWFRVLFLLSLFFLLLVIPVKAQLSGEIRIHVGGDKILGEVDQSSLEEGYNYTVDLHLNLSGAFGERWDYYSYLDLRQSTDIMVERYEDLQLKRFFFQLNHDNHTYRLGNLYTDLGRYFFNQRYRGLDLSQGIGPFQIRGLIGERHPGKEGEQYARYNYGLRLNLPLFSTTTISAITTTTFDAPDSVEKALGDPISNQVHGLILNTSWGPISLQGTFSQSTTEVANAYSTGESFLIQGDYRLNRILLSGGLEYVSPSFFTLGGTAVADRQTINLRLRARISEPFQLDLRYSHFHNNLEDQLQRTTIQQSPRIQFSYTPMALRGMRITGWTNVLKRTSSDEEINQDELTLGFRCLYRIRLITLEVGVEHDYRWDYQVVEETSQGTSYSASLRGNYQLNDQILQPGILLSLKDQKKKDTVTVSPLFQLELGLLMDHDRIKISWSDRYQDVDAIREGGRRTFSFVLGRSFSDTEEIELSYSYNSYFFQDSTNDYEDHRVKIGYLYRF